MSRGMSVVVTGRVNHNSASFQPPHLTVLYAKSRIQPLWLYMHNALHCPFYKHYASFACVKVGVHTWKYSFWKTMQEITNFGGAIDAIRFSHNICSFIVTPDVSWSLLVKFSTGGCLRKKCFWQEIIVLTSKGLFAFRYQLLTVFFVAIKTGLVSIPAAAEIRRFFFL